MILAELLEAARRRFWDEPEYTDQGFTYAQNARTAATHYVDEAVTTVGIGAQLLMELCAHEPEINWEEVEELIVGFTGAAEGLRDIITAAVITLLLHDEALAAEELKRQELDTRNR